MREEDKEDMREEDEEKQIKQDEEDDGYYVNMLNTYVS
jgi:hypothetical protein